ncbi:hypothetical protein BKP45_04440 [Anaerobacillus alkalidiazotrophicus]|uniref:Uncharacterized protein n=1 Tax=Anaerobacillus alkalidiazotrophicus TaxID=472963 RepID=A0A1S2MBX1_9BACI|nr:hypothetical protein [Anaerobacillus alkalidiazotrophicus]OIJ21933.1 hypothetical protein BKP45_04440 [Anaerobacillus alkalidiazotrophicus]
MNDLIDRILGFLPHRGIFWTAVALCIVMFITRSVTNWLVEKVKLPWMEEKNQKQRKAFQEGNGAK